jgi:hypothetical protein
VSYTVSFYSININKLRNTIEEKNLSILDESDLDDENRKYAETLITGTEPDLDDIPSEYGYTLEKIVKHLFGGSENVPEFEDLRFGEFNDPPLDWIIKSGSPVKLPPNDNFPYIGHRTIAEMQKTLDDWNDEQYDDFVPEAQEIIEALLNVFQRAVEQKKDLITFYY